MTISATTSATTLSPATGPTVAPTRPEPTLEDGDHERMSHIVLEGFKRKGDAGEKTGNQAEGSFIPMGTNVVEGMVNGTPVRALCGKTWVPGRDPKRYPLCPTCREIAERMGWKLPAT